MAYPDETRHPVAGTAQQKPRNRGSENVEVHDTPGELQVSQVLDQRPLLPSPLKRRQKLLKRRSTVAIPSGMCGDC